VAGDEPARRAAWLDEIYSDTVLTIRVVGSTVTSTSSMPSLMWAMLDALEVEPGHRVLEIGTGSGYNAALLSERLGDELVTSVDVDGELVELARARLAQAGY